MNTVVLILNIIIPIVMLLIGILYKFKVYKKAHRILEFIISPAMMFSGLSDNKYSSGTYNKNLTDFKNLRYGLIWMISGAALMLAVIGSLILNDGVNIPAGIQLLEIECFVLVLVYVTVNFMVSRKRYNND